MKFLYWFLWLQFWFINILTWLFWWLLGLKLWSQRTRSSSRCSRYFIFSHRVFPLFIMCFLVFKLNIRFLFLSCQSCHKFSFIKIWLWCNKSFRSECTIHLVFNFFLLFLNFYSSFVFFSFLQKFLYGLIWIIILAFSSFENLRLKSERFILFCFWFDYYIFTNSRLPFWVGFLYVH